MYEKSNECDALRQERDNIITKLQSATRENTSNLHIKEDLKKAKKANVNIVSDKNKLTDKVEILTETIEQNEIQIKDYETIISNLKGKTVQLEKDSYENEKLLHKQTICENDANLKKANDLIAAKQAIQDF